MRLAIFLLLLVGLTACGKKPALPTKPGEPQGRVETEAIRSVEALGYSGEGIARKVDGALDANDQRKAELDKAIDAQSQPQ